MVAPHARHHRRHAVKRPFLYIGPLMLAKSLPEDRVGVAEQDRIDARDLTQVVNGVFCHGPVRIGGEARVGDNDHQIGAFFAHFRHVFTRGFGDVVNGHLTVEVGLIPRHDLRRDKTDIADFQRLFFPS